MTAQLPLGQRRLAQVLLPTSCAAAATTTLKCACQYVLARSTAILISPSPPSVLGGGDGGSAHNRTSQSSGKEVAGEHYCCSHGQAVYCVAELYKTITAAVRTVLRRTAIQWMCRFPQFLLFRLPLGAHSFTVERRPRQRRPPSSFPLPDCLTAAAAQVN